ncbi:MAG: hypothetical protein IIX97_04805 [Clostridia bacterium]|nr:hypothetical protein [Clostridia bacterium]
MKEIKILHLFPKLLSLYGEYGNVKITEKYLKENGYSVSVTECEFPKEIDLTEFDFFYIGSGTEANMIEASKRLLSKKECIKELVENKKCFLVTGNAIALFGKTVSMNGKDYAMLSTFDYSTGMYTDKRFSGDILTNDKNIFASKLIGYVNTSCVYYGIEGGLCEMLLGSDLGNDKRSALDGFTVNNFFATQLIGPFAVKNPQAMKKICEVITGDTLPLDMTSHQGLAYKRALTALEERLTK